MWFEVKFYVLILFRYNGLRNGNKIKVGFARMVNIQNSCVTKTICREKDFRKTNYLKIQRPISLKVTFLPYINIPVL